MCVCRCAACTCGDCFVRTRARVATRTGTDWVCEHTSVGCVHECARLGAQHAAAWVFCVHSTALCRVRVQQMRCTCVQSSARARSAGSGSQGAPRRVRSVLGTHSVCTNVEQVCVARGCPAGGWQGAAELQHRTCRRCRRSVCPPCSVPCVGEPQHRGAPWWTESSTVPTEH